MKLKSKSIDWESGLNSIGLKFDATAEDGAKASDEKNIMLGATAKYTLKAYADSMNFGDLATTINSKLEVEGKASFNSMSVLTTGQKATAGVEWTAKISGFPASLALSTKAYESIDTMPSAQNITLKYGAEGSATVTFSNISTKLTVDGGYGYTANFTADSDSSTVASSIGAKLELPLTKRWSLFGQYKFINIAPVSGEFPKTQVGTDSQVTAGFTFK